MSDVFRQTALVFPGQGSQRPRMLAEAPEHEALDRLLDAAEALSDLPLREIDLSGGEDDLRDTRVAQPLLYLTDWAWGTALVETGFEPDSVAGHSLGELVALAIAGVFSVEAGLELVVERSRLMSRAAHAQPGAMAAVIGMEASAISGVLGGMDGVWIANDNAPGQIIISGTSDGVARAADSLSDAGARRVMPLNVSGAFHSPVMEAARAAFADILLETTFSDARIPVLQNTDPVPETSADRLRERLLTQITSPVRWTETMQALAGTPDTLMVEAGPGGVLTGLAKRVTGIAAVSAETVGLEAVMMEAGRA